MSRGTGTGNRVTKMVGVAALAVTAAVVILGLAVTPPDQVQGDLVRLIYVHPAVSTWAFTAFGITALASVAYLVPRTRRRQWDLVAGASAEVGVVLCALSLATGSIWGRPAWGVWWTWDARLTLTALLLALFLGYLALRRVMRGSSSRRTVVAIAGVLFSAVVPVDHFATEWFRTLHQGDTLFRGKPLIHGQQLNTMLLSFLAFGLIGAWLLIHRYRLEQLEERFETEGLEQALTARRAEGTDGARAPEAVLAPVGAGGSDPGGAGGSGSAGAGGSGSAGAGGSGSAGAGGSGSAGAGGVTAL